MSLKSVFGTLKQSGLIKELDQYLLKQTNGESDMDRVNITNSPSSALGCSRANYYQRTGTTKDIIEPRVRRIFDNGHGMHDRIQKYLTDMGILIMDEVPLVHEAMEIQGHTDGFLDFKGDGKEIKILELKSINGNQFSGLRGAREDHMAQANVYIFVAEEQRLKLKELYPTPADFRKSAITRRFQYTQRYQHLKDGSKFTKAEKIKHKVEQHIKMDKILYGAVKPIKDAVVLYECKNTQELKEFNISTDNALLTEVLRKYKINNKAWADKKMPPRECKAKSEGRFCAFVNECFE